MVGLSYDCATIEAIVNAWTIGVHILHPRTSLLPIRSPVYLVVHYASSVFANVEPWAALVHFARLIASSTVTLLLRCGAVRIVLPPLLAPECSGISSGQVLILFITSHEDGKGCEHRHDEEQAVLQKQELHTSDGGWERGRRK